MFEAVGDLRFNVDVDCGTLLLCCLGVRCFGVVLSLIDDDVIAEFMSVSIILIVLPSQPSGSASTKSTKLDSLLFF